MGRNANVSMVREALTLLGPGRIAATQYDPVWTQQAFGRTLRFFGNNLN